jgi:hypothetical protein
MPDIDSEALKAAHAILEEIAGQSLTCTTVYQQDKCFKLATLITAAYAPRIAAYERMRGHASRFLDAYDDAVDGTSLPGAIELLNSLTSLDELVTNGVERDVLCHYCTHEIIPADEAHMRIVEGGPVCQECWEIGEEMDKGKR